MFLRRWESGKRDCCEVHLNLKDKFQDHKKYQTYHLSKEDIYRRWKKLENLQNRIVQYGTALFGSELGHLDPHDTQFDDEKRCVFVKWVQDNGQSSDSRDPPLNYLAEDTVLFNMQSEGSHETKSGFHITSLNDALSYLLESSKWKVLRDLKLMFCLVVDGKTSLMQVEETMLCSTGKVSKFQRLAVVSGSTFTTEIPLKPEEYTTDISSKPRILSDIQLLQVAYSMGSLTNDFDLYERTLYDYWRQESFTVVSHSEFPHQNLMMCNFLGWQTDAPQKWLEDVCKANEIEFVRKDFATSLKEVEVRIVSAKTSILKPTFFEFQCESKWLNHQENKESISTFLDFSCQVNVRSFIHWFSKETPVGLKECDYVIVSRDHLYQLTDWIGAEKVQTILMSASWTNLKVAFYCIPLSEQKYKHIYSICM